VTFLVTGAAGFIGSHSTDLLLEKGFSVVGIDNLRTGHLKNLETAETKKGFIFCPMDIVDEKALRKLFEDCKFDGVLHLAALVSVEESFMNTDSNAQVNLYGTDLLARLCIEYGCKRFVFASSAAVYGGSPLLPSREDHKTNPGSPYAGAKRASEVMLLSYAAHFDMDVVCFRYFNVYGQRQNPYSPYAGVLSIFLECFSSNRSITVYGDGEQTRDFVSVQDVAFANTHALTTTSHFVSGQYNVCTGYATSLNHVLDMLRKSYSKSPRVHYTDARVGDIRHSLGDIGHTKNTLGIVAQISLEEGLRNLIDANL
jgi:UDP-glucose 4-epimerase